MKSKTLRPTTIIPKHLYVERAADRQLRSIIEDMGRPGYILVARQMGKTNLLINMKRERTSDVVLYLDLSNRFDSVRAWFRNVIDSLIESYSDEFNDIGEVIHNQRGESSFEPNVEYDRHLRLLLRSTKKRLIIVLDEIDSLVNAPYSDVILAQVRSMYFSRVNYPEYERLTYILSGVAEPTDLIKDKNISPFNIGEKIYLEEFSRGEFDLFLEKSGVQSTAEVADAIFSWAAGNPRMSWDICSELEDRINSGEIATSKTIDAIVDRLYLRDFDRAPVDHIRTLVESDASIRDAIVSIRYGKSSYLDDKIRSKLYLSGIARLSSEGSVEIKNKIIDSALSDRWLSQLTSARTSFLKHASDSFGQKNYEEALKQYEQIFLNSDAASGISINSRMEFALCYFYTGNSNRSLQELEICLSEADDEKPVQTLNYYIGVCHVGIGSYKKAVSFLRKALDGPIADIRIAAKLSMMPALLGINPSLYGKEVIGYGVELISELDTPGVHEDSSRSDLLVTALFNTAISHVTLGDFTSAEKAFDSAMDLSPVTHKTAILLRQYDLPQNITDRARLASEAARVIIDNEIQLSLASVDSLRLNRSMLAQTLVRLNNQSLNCEFDELVRYAATHFFKPDVSPAEALLHTFESLNGEEKRTSYISLLEMGVSLYFSEITDPAIKLRLLRFVSAYSDGPQADLWRGRYLDELTNVSDDKVIDDEDLAALTRVAFSFMSKRRHKELRRVFDLVRSWESLDWPETDSWFIILKYYEMEYLLSSGMKEQARQMASQLISLADKIQAKSSNEDDIAFIPEIRNKAVSLLPREPIRNIRSQKIGRNDKVIVRYGNDEIVTKKYKIVEPDLAAGRCVLVDS